MLNLVEKKLFMLLLILYNILYCILYCIAIYFIVLHIVFFQNRNFNNCIVEKKNNIKIMIFFHALPQILKFVPT